MDSSLRFYPAGAKRWTSPPAAKHRNAKQARYRTSEFFPKHFKQWRFARLERFERLERLELF
jgi:hypothetical protein